MEILNHPDSQWGPGDFDLSLINLPQLPTPQTAPPFLPPTHEPKMRLPSISALWDTNHDVTQSARQTIPSHSAEHDSCEQPAVQEVLFPPTNQDDQDDWRARTDAVPFSLSTPTPTKNVATIQLTPPGVEHTAALRSDSYHSNSETVDLPPYDEASTFQQTLGVEAWARTHHNDNGIDDEPGQSFEHAQSFADVQYLPTASHEAHDTESSYLGCQVEPLAVYSPQQERVLPHESSPRNYASEPSVLGAPLAIPLGRPAIDMPPRSRKRSRKSSVAKTKAEDREGGHEERKDSEDVQLEVSRGEHAVSRKQATGSGPFIHGLCGKGFATRSKVKKHHWGGKVNNLETTTGCWAKHNKPNANWDDHPSCKEGVQNSMKAKKIKRRSTSTDHKTPPRRSTSTGHKSPPSISPDQKNSLPAYTSFEDQPPTVVEALDPSHRSRLSTQEAYLPYHNHHLPQSPFESLLTAVNVASKIEAPVPQGRNDSVVSQLDAQALAAERAGQYLPTWAYSAHQYDENFEYIQRYQPAYAGYGHGFGTSPAPLSMSTSVAYPSRIHAYTYASSTVSPTEPRADFGNLSTIADHVGEHATIQGHCDYSPREWGSVRLSLSPGLEHKMRRRV